MRYRFVASALASILALAAFVAAAGYEEYALYNRGGVSVLDRDGTTRPMLASEVNAMARLATLEALPRGVAAALALALPAAIWGQGTRGWPRVLAAFAGLIAGALTGSALSLLAGLWVGGPTPPYLRPAAACGAVLFAAAGALWPRPALVRDGPP